MKRGLRAGATEWPEAGVLQRKSYGMMFSFRYFRGVGLRLRPNIGMGWMGVKPTDGWGST